MKRYLINTQVKATKENKPRYKVAKVQNYSHNFLKKHLIIFVGEWKGENERASTFHVE